MKMLTYLHKLLYTWWCWHICKGKEVGVDVDQLGEEKEEFQGIGLCLGRDQTLHPTFGEAVRNEERPQFIDRMLAQWRTRHDAGASGCSDVH